MADNPLIIALVHDTDDAAYGHITYDGDRTYAKVVTGDLAAKKLDSGVEWRFGADFAIPVDARTPLSALVRFTLITPPSAAHPIVLTLLDCGASGVTFAASTAEEVYAAIVGGAAAEFEEIKSTDDTGVVTKAITGDALTIITSWLGSGGTVMLGGYQVNADDISECFISRDAGMTLELTFAAPPTVTTAPVTAVTTATATGGGEVTSDGGAEVTVHGVCWSTSPNPTTADDKAEAANGTGEFIASITDLLPGTSYHVRAYAVNSEGTAYGDDVQFRTSTGRIIRRPSDSRPSRLRPSHGRPSCSRPVPNL